ncbi:uncharacterized protein [Acropora muricata]|uniref:uncharacterized protein isoform X2 n=1 Tax=Acropora muricata TaxID=159855 RepID=UPI0034E408F5
MLKMKAQTDLLILRIGLCVWSYNLDSNDDELLQRPFDNITVDPPPQGRHRRFNPATRTSTITQTVNLVTQSKGFYGTPLYGDGIRAGTVKEDLLPIGLDGASTCSFDSRTDEVSRCESLLRATCTNNDTSLLPFLIHTFEEVCWQAYHNKRAIVVVLLNPTGQSQYWKSMLSVLQNVQENSNREEWFFWAAETTSDNGRKVLEKYGNGREDQIIFLVQSTQQTPVFVDRIEGPVLTGFDQTRLFDKIKAMIRDLCLEREQHDQWRQLRREQEDDLQQMISGTHHQLGNVEENLVTNEC